MPKLEKTELLAVRVTSPVRRAAERAATQAGMTSADWLRAVILRAVEEAGISPAQKPQRRGKSRRREG